MSFDNKPIFRLNGKAKVGGSFSKKKKWKNAKRTRYRNGRRYLS